MQNEPTTVRGYSPQDTGRMNTLPYQPQENNTVKSLWKQLDPAAVVLMVAAILGLAYALYATISFWWLTKILVHLILVWVTVGISALALFTGNRMLTAIAAIGYVVSMLLFVNYFYLLLPQAGLCAFSWWKAAH
ncbi:MAG: hypothetical protein E7316_00255 [Clostridiales bacterium]|nr:hypothetical protein [Clostridiales bacterium]